VATIDDDTNGNLEVVVMLGTDYYREWSDVDFVNMVPVNQGSRRAVNARFCLDLDQSVWMEIDFVEIFCDEDDLQRIQGLFSTVDEMMKSYGDVIPDHCLEEFQRSYDRATDYWTVEDFNKAGICLTSATQFLQRWGEYVDLLPVAKEVIANSTDMDPALLDGLNRSFHRMRDSFDQMTCYPPYLKTIIETPGLLLEAEEAMAAAEEIGVYAFILDIMKQKYTSARRRIEAGWTATGELNWIITALLRRKGELKDERNRLLFQAEEAIKQAEDTYKYQSIVNGMKINYLQGNLQSVFDTAGKYFNISIPEPALLPILGIILLPILIYRRSIR
jgi:hypothetical protein